MRVGIDFRRRSTDGVGRVTSLVFEALIALSPEVEVVAFGRPDSLPNHLRAQGVQLVPFDFPLISQDGSETLPRLVQEARIDLMIAPQFYVLPNLPCKLVTILHDAYPFHPDGLVPDMEELLNLFGELSLVALRRDLGDHVPADWHIRDQDAVLGLYYGMYEMNAASASRIATVSEHSRHELLARFPIATGKIDILSPFVSENLSGAMEHGREGESAEFIHIGKWEPRKRHLLLINAARLCREDIPDLRLHLVGAAWMAHVQHASAIQDTLVKGKADGWLRWSQNLSDGELAGLYRSARATVLTPSFEGFGLPALEAMVLGSPLATTGNGALNEICGDADFRLPENVEGIASSLARLWNDDELLSALKRRGFIRSQSYSKERTCSELRSCLHRALG